MQRPTIIVAALLLLTPAAAQDHVYEDLLSLYVDEEYPKCIAKAARYIEKDNTRRDALPYLYTSMCWHEISRLDKYAADPEFKNAHREALKYAVKFRKKDKDLVYFSNYEDYWQELNTFAMDAGLVHLDMGEYSKAKRQFDRMVEYQPENAGAWQLLALSQLKMRLAREAARSIEGFDRAYASIPDIERLPVDQRRLLREGLVRYAAHLQDTGQADSARAVIGLGAEHFSRNPEYNALLRELN